MKTVITARRKLQPTKEQFAALRATQLAYRDALKLVSQYAFAHGKLSNKIALQATPLRRSARAFSSLPNWSARSVARWERPPKGYAPQ
ncbi:hypothetical protein EI42_06354 [Thermosporothrix hazakensis]|jgi:hypothetical protein|uniref:Transposase n=1 Tax=Thermosporothrix hazakensis TaxID=644383 RepID=A0A326TSC8_THEHA|nr:hypothetical protein EI42_06354 [Thermosporothrix hazakensis]